MQYLVIGYDGSDKDALTRRMAARPAHIELGDSLKASGKLLYAVAILDENQKMIGSVLICDFATKEELDGWLTVEPYVTGEVWKTIEIKPCKIGPSFLGK